MNEFHGRIRPDWPSVLREIVGRAQSLQSRAILAFDLDSTLFDNRPRQARILSEYGRARNIPALAQCGPHHWTSGWDMRGAMQRCGLSAEQAAALLTDAKQFWFERFFTSEYCNEDVAIEGAVDFVQTCVKTGAQVCYVTGRHEAMRQGSIDAMRKEGFPLPGGLTRLIIKPTLEMHDDDFKRLAHAELKGLGEVVAAFDNEPIHVNDYRRAFPEATVVHLATDHSGRQVLLEESVVTIPSFSIEK